MDAAAVPEDREDFAVYVEEKIGLAQQATDVKNMGGFIVKAIRENYEDPVFRKRTSGTEIGRTKGDACVCCGPRCLKSETP